MSRTTVILAGLLLASGVPLQLAGGGLQRVVVGVVATALLAGAATAAHRWSAARSVVDSLLALAVLSVFGWASAAILAVPAVSVWVGAAPVALAFLVVNALKLTSVVPLLVVARCRQWSWRSFLVRRGHPGTRPWPWLAPLTMLAVEALFLGLTPGVDLHRASALAPWLPLMVAGALVNAVCEELLYRHALVGTLRGVVGTTGAVLTSSLVFGLAHLTGTPGGISGVVFTAGYGLVCALAMQRTRGAVWNVAIHVAGDVSAVSTLFLAG